MSWGQILSPLLGDIVDYDIGLFYFAGGKMDWKYMTEPDGKACKGKFSFLFWDYIFITYIASF